MAHRTILTPKQREVLFGFPADEPRLLKHYTLSDEDLDHIGQRRRPRNRLGFALQLCALRYPGRALLPEELIPAEITRFLAAQLGLKDADLDAYAAREETRQAVVGPTVDESSSVMWLRRLDPTRQCSAKATQRPTSGTFTGTWRSTGGSAAGSSLRFKQSTKGGQSMLAS